MPKTIEKFSEQYKASEAIFTTLHFLCKLRMLVLHYNMLLERLAGDKVMKKWSGVSKYGPCSLFVSYLWQNDP
jgi:hypothetical protein